MNVMEPPNIDDDATPSEQSVAEHSAVTLNCRATGRPLPSITWKKEHGRVAVRNGKSGAPSRGSPSHCLR